MVINSLFLVGFLLSCLLIIGGMASILFLLVDIWSFKQILLFQIFEMLISIGIVYLSIIGVRQLWQTYIIRKGRFFMKKHYMIGGLFLVVGIIGLLVCIGNQQFYDTGKDYKKKLATIAT